MKYKYTPYVLIIIIIIAVFTLFVRNEEFINIIGNPLDASGNLVPSNLDLNIIGIILLILIFILLLSQSLSFKN